MKLQELKILLFIIFPLLYCSCEKTNLDNSISENSRIDTVEIYSESMNNIINNIIITPPNYKELKNLPVVYLLHGAYGNYTDWSINVVNLKDFCEEKNIIIVCPDGGFNSWYFDSPIDNQFMYETYITKELISHIDSTYPTSKNYLHRAITGLSMGGHGAFYLAIRNQDLYVAAGSMSGLFDLRPFSNEWNIADRLGNINDFPHNWENNSVVNLTDHLLDTDLKLIFDCGSEDVFLEINNLFHEKLVINNIEHEYIIREGNHNWNYWSLSIFEHLFFFNNIFEYPTL